MSELTILHLTRRRSRSAHQIPLASAPRRHRRSPFTDHTCAQAVWPDYSQWRKGCSDGPHGIFKHQRRDNQDRRQSGGGGDRCFDHWERGVRLRSCRLPPVLVKWSPLVLARRVTGALESVMYVRTMCGRSPCWNVESSIVAFAFQGLSLCKARSYVLR